MLLMAKKPARFRIILISTLVLIFSVIIGLTLYTDLYFRFFGRPIGKFGCPYTSEGYTLKIYNPLEAWPDDLFSPPVWGEERQPLVLANEAELEELIQYIDDINGEVLEFLPYNSVDNFLQFYAAYNTSNLDFRSFYATYVPTFRPAENCIGLAIESLERIHSRLTSRWPQIAEHTYLVSSRNLSAEWMRREEWERVEEQDGVYHMMGSRELKHVLGALKVEVSGRQGFILLDQGYGIVRPIVLMLDGQPPHDYIIREHDYNDLNQYELSDSNRYVLWNVIFHEQNTPRDRLGELHRIYVQRPYCSFLYNTEKRDVARPLRSIISRTRLGRVRHGFFFRLRLNAETAVKLMQWKAGDEYRHDDWVPLRSLSRASVEQNLITADQLEKISDMNDLLGYTPGVLLEKLQQIEAIMHDVKFMQGCEQLNEEELKTLSIIGTD